MGYNWDADPEAETYRLNFDTFPPRVEIYSGDVRILDAYAGICDSFGNLQLYTNNCSISNSEGQIIANGDSMTFDWELEWCQTYGWHLYEMHNLFIPMSTKSNGLFLLNKSTYKSTSSPLIIYQNRLNYSVIDLKGENEAPKVLEKNNKVFQDRLGYGQITAVKHGNGRDWWLPIPEEIGNKIFMVLCSADSFYLNHTESLGIGWGDSGVFQASFSQDGSMYARYNRFYGLYLYDFDRCNGTLYNLRHYPFTSTTQGLRSGVGFSPNGHFLYFADYDSLYQLDVSVSDIAATKELVAVYDGYVSSLGTKFAYIIQGPDGRVYIKPPGPTSSIHVINRPNIKGVDCDVKQHFIEFPNPYGNPPNHPNYRLGPLDGSPCDTLSINNHPLADFRPDPSDTNHLAIHFWDVSSYLPAEWLWNFGDGSPVSQDTSPVHTFPAPGFYTVCLTVGNVYGVSSKCKVVEVKVSSTNAEPSGQGERSSVLFCPNPTTGWLEWNVIADGESMRLRVYDALGRLCFARKTSDNKANLSELPDGVYFVSLLGENGRIVATKAIVLAKK